MAPRLWRYGADEFHGSIVLQRCRAYGAGYGHPCGPEWRTGRSALPPSLSMNPELVIEN
jgi:hypothetical protein